MTKLTFDQLSASLPFKYYTIQLDKKKIVQTNDTTVNQGEDICFKKLFNKELPCQLKNGKCICQQLIDKNTVNEYITEREGKNKKFFKANFKNLGNNLVVVSYQDVTEEFKAKKEIKINTKRLERAEKLVDFGYWEFNIDEKVIISSKGARKIYGVKDRQIPLEVVQQISLPKYRRKLDLRLRNLITNGKPYNIQFAIKRPSDDEIRMIHSIAEYRDDKRMVFGVIHDITEKINSKNALEESLTDLNLAQDIAKVGNWKYNPITTELKWSEQLYKMFERDSNSGSVTAKEYRKYYGPENESILKKAMAEAIKNGTSFDLKFNIILRGGEKKWIEYICRPENRTSTSGYFLRGTIQDITQNKKIEEELNKSNKLLRTIIDIIPDSIYMKDKSYRKLVANKGDAAHCGVENISEIIGKTDFDLYPKKIAEKYTEDDRKVIENGEKIINKEEILPDKKRDRWILTSKIPLKDYNDEIIGLVGIGRDITELKEQASKLQLLQQTVEQSPLSVIITNEEGIIEYVNPSFTKISGYTFDEVVGKSPGIVKSGLHDQSFYQDIWETVHSGNTWYGEFHNKKKNGSLYWESTVIAPILDEKNEIKHFVSINEDITEKKQIVKELEIARDKAEESDRLKSIFLANMSHEIRTPLNGILGFSNLICSGGVEEKNKLEYYNTIIDNCGKRLITVIDDIIDISMIQSNQLKIEYGNFDIDELLQELFILYKSQKSEQLSKIDLRVIFCQSSESKKLYSDKHRIFQVLKNLLDNAFKFTESGFIEFGCAESNKDKLILYVKDSGIGIEKEKEDLIFESFRQVEEGNSKRYDGSGLGLAITSGIIERLGGKVWVESEIGKGSAFYVDLPLSGKKKINDPLAVQQNKIKPLNGKKISKKRILSIEDDEASIVYLKSAVSSMGYEIINFVKAKDGIDYLKNNHVDLVLMDVQLPEMDGYEATRIIKSEFPDLPVIIQTAYAMKGDKEKSYSAGCDEYLSKPINHYELKEKIKSYIE